MACKTFVSFNYRDREIVKSIKSFSQVNHGKVQGKFQFVENDCSMHGDSSIDNEIRKVMDNCDAALFIIGESNHNSPWINREAELAISKDLFVVVTKMKKTNGGLPNKLKDKAYPITDFDEKEIAYHLNRSNN